MCSNRPRKAAAAPPAPADLTVAAAGHHRVSLAWAASPGAAFYRVWRTTLHPDGVGGFNPLGRVLLDDAVDAITYADTSPTDGREYGYVVEAVNAAGISSPAVVHIGAR